MPSFFVRQLSRFPSQQHTRPAAPILRSIAHATALAVGLLIATSVSAKDRWVQVHAELTYSRTYTFAKNEPKYQEKSQFTFNLNGSLDQMMWRMDPGKGEKYPTYHTADEVPPSFKNSGALTLSASFNGNDQLANRVDSGSANLKGVIKSWDDFHIETINPEPPIGVALMAQVLLNTQLTGTATSTLPKMPDTRDQDVIFFWPTPVKFDHDTSAFLSEFQIQVRTPLGPRPSNGFEAKLYDLTVATTEMTSAPQVGGSSLATTNASLSGSVEDWILTSTFSRDVPIGSDRGSYHETMTITIKPVATTLKVPPSPVD